MTLLLELGKGSLDALMPMNVVIGATGHIRHVGPTLLKLEQGGPFVGARLLERFQIRSPASVATLDALAAFAGRRLHLQLRSGPETRFKGLVMPLPGAKGGWLLNLSFGIGATEAVRDHGLTSGDFAPTDLTVEMLYLVEAKTAVMEELKCLNQRLRGARDEAEEQAYTDTLTGLRNRRALDQVLIRYTAQGAGFALMHVDLDYFKDVNDRLGHAAGDHVLRHVAEVLKAETRTDDTVVRSGGDEFVIVFRELTAPDLLTAIARRIIYRLEQPISFGDGTCRISASIGTTISESYPKPDPGRMLEDADIALYASKRAGRAQATLYSDALRGDGRETQAQETIQ